MPIHETKQLKTLQFGHIISAKGMLEFESDSPVDYKNQVEPNHSDQATITSDTTETEYTIKKSETCNKLEKVDNNRNNNNPNDTYENNNLIDTIQCIETTETKKCLQS